MPPDHQKHGHKKDIFQRLEWLKTCFEAFLHASRPPGKKFIFLRLERLKTFFDAFAYLEWLKTFFDAFSHASRPTETWLKKDVF
jgi:hypothetical protein